MKKFFLLVVISLFITNISPAQDDANKKVRAGLKGVLEPGWFDSGDNNTTPFNAGVGGGFGLVLEFRMSDVIYFSTGIGGDFENASVKYRNDNFVFPTNTNVFTVNYFVDNSGALVEAANDVDKSTYMKDGNISYKIESRNVKSTFITIPVALKMMTKEFSGFKIFGSFGGDIGIRIATKADDTYYYKTVYTGTAAIPVGTTEKGTLSNLDIGKDGSLIPMRVGLDVGLGAEYRIGGSTSVFFSVNYFRSFTNVMKIDSKVFYTGSTIDTNNKIVFTHLQQNLIMSSLKFTLGIMF